MSQELLAAIREKKGTLPEVNRLVIEGKVPAILRNFSQIKGRNYNRSKIYRQVNSTDYHRPSWLEMVFDFWCSAAFASPERGNVILAEVGSWGSWRQMLVPPEFQAAPRDPWEIEDDIANFNLQLRSAIRSGDTQAMRTIALKIKYRTEELLRCCNEQEGHTVLDEFRAAGRGLFAGR